MGIAYSIEKLSKIPGVDNAVDVDSTLRLSLGEIQSIVSCYVSLQYPPMIDSTNLHSLFMNASKANALNGTSGSQVFLLWKIFEVQSM
jgi:hypothetical protein